MPIKVKKVITKNADALLKDIQEESAKVEKMNWIPPEEIAKQIELALEDKPLLWQMHPLIGEYIKKVFKDAHFTIRAFYRASNKRDGDFELVFDKVIGKPLVKDVTQMGFKVGKSPTGKLWFFLYKLGKQ